MFKKRIAWNKGLKMSGDFCKKISLRTKGKKQSKETIEKRVLKLKGKKRTQEFKDLISKLKKGKPQYWQRGENHYNWKGGKVSLNRQIWHSLMYFDWRSKIFIRDNWTCQTCGKRGCHLEAHHIITVNNLIKKYNLKTIEDVERCADFWIIDNGVTLCKDCHNLTKGYPKQIYV
jgi:hypothetical protein